ncbi:MAG: GNAT family N-acetyltransferase [Myxococcales bacterium]
METTFRRATGADRDVAHRLLTDQLVEHRLPADAEGIRRGIDAALLPHSPAWLWLAEREGRAIGVFLANRIVSVEKGGYALWVEELYVVPEERRTGVARALLTRIRDEARKEGIRALDLEVVPTQAAALALYEALGFEKVNRLRISLPLYGDG